MIWNETGKWWLFTIAYMGVIFVGSSIPEDNIPSVYLPWSDKIAHLLQYTLLGWLLGKAFISSGFRFPMILAVLVGILYGVSDEVHQLFVPNRECDVRDLIFDGLGCILAQIIIKCSNKQHIKKL